MYLSTVYRVQDYLESKNVTVMTYLQHYVSGNYPLKRNAPLKKYIMPNH